MLTSVYCDNPLVDLASSSRALKSKKHTWKLLIISNRTNVRRGVCSIKVAGSSFLKSLWLDEFGHQSKLRIQQENPALSC